MSYTELESEIKAKLVQCELMIKGAEAIMQIRGSKRIRTKIAAEHQFLSRLLRDPSKIKKEHLRSTNLPHLEAMLSCIKSSQNVVEILKPFPWTDETGTICQHNVDVVADFGATWIKIVARNPQALLRSSLGAGSYGKRTLIQQILDLQQCAKFHPYLYKPPKIQVWFTSGVTNYLLSQLHKLNVEPTGNVMELEDDCDISEIVGSDTESDDEIISDENNAPFADLTNAEYSSGLSDSGLMTMDEIPKGALLNIDVSTMICYVSNLTNGRSNFTFKDSILTEQAERERLAPVKPILDQLFEDCHLICCQMAYDDFQEILTVVGGPQERTRAEELLSRVKLVENQISHKTAQLNVTCKIKQRSRVVFGTGDALQAITVTANHSFVRAAAAQGLRFVSFLHESRALTEMKEPTGLHHYLLVRKEPGRPFLLCNHYYPA